MRKNLLEFPTLDSTVVRFANGEHKIAIASLERIL